MSSTDALELQDAVAVRDTLKTTTGQRGRGFFARPLIQPSVPSQYFFQSPNDYALFNGTQYIWYGTFTSGTPSNNTFDSWRFFLANLPSSASSLCILGTNDTVGKTLTTNVSTFIQNMKAGAMYSISQGGSDTWYVNTGCTTNSPVAPSSPLFGTTSGEPVFISWNIQGCTCGFGYMIRPHIQNGNWGGINILRWRTTAVHVMHNNHLVSKLKIESVNFSRLSKKL